MGRILIMSNRIYGAIALAALAISSAASGQSFTYNSTATPPSMVVGGVAPDGKPFGAQAFSGTSDIMMDGKAMKNSFKCVSMTQPANDQVFNYHMMCDVAAPDGTFTSAWGCTVLGKQESSCIGRMLGQTGAYAKRSGNITGHSKGTMSVGAGQWNQ
jgi:hypothetical protein